MHRPMRTTRRLANLQQGRPGWYRIKNIAGGPARVDIFDEIGFLAVSAEAFTADLAAVEGDIELHLNCPGGDVFDGIAIYNQLKQRPGTVAVVVDGLAASAASFIAQAASPGMLAMAPHSQMMIHDAFGMGIGNAADMRELAGLLDKASDNIAGIYADRSGKPAAYWRERMRAESWFSDAEAVADGLADKILGQESPQNSWDLSVYLNAPQNADGNHAPMTGSHTHSHPDGRGGDHRHEHEHEGDAAHTGHDHSSLDGEDGDGSPPMEARLRNADMHGDHERYDPDGDGDCDACPEGDTDHDFWSEDGRQLKPLPGKPLTDRFGHAILNADVDESDWDGPAAMAAAGKAENPASAFRAICAGEHNAGEPDQRQHWALPHHKHPGAAPNRHGVNNALSRLPGTQDLKNKQAAQSHLEAHQRAMGSGTSDLADEEIWAALAVPELFQLDAGKE